jgi:hypothetical protein
MSSEPEEVQENKPPEETMQSLQSQLPVVPETEIDKKISQLLNVSGDIFHEPTCIICSSPYREDIEQKWLETKRYPDVQTLIKTKMNIDVSKAAIENHMVHHCNQAVKAIQMGEYKDRISRLNSVKLTTLDYVEMCLSALTERLMGVNSITPSGDYSVADIEKIKSAETTKLMASFDRLLKLQASILGEMKTSGELITIPRDAFVAFFTKSVTEANNDQEREIIKRILTDLSQLGKST